MVAPPIDVIVYLRIRGHQTYVGCDRGSLRDTPPSSGVPEYRCLRRSNLIAWLRCCASAHLPASSPSCPIPVPCFTISLPHPRPSRSLTRCILACRCTPSVEEQPSSLREYGDAHLPSLGHPPPAASVFLRHERGRRRAVPNRGRYAAPRVLRHAASGDERLTIRQHPSSIS
jgi:hypothetical protein